MLRRCRPSLNPLVPEMSPKQNKHVVLTHAMNVLILIRQLCLAVVAGQQDVTSVKWEWRAVHQVCLTTFYLPIICCISSVGNLSNATATATRSCPIHPNHVDSSKIVTNRSYAARMVCVIFAPTNRESICATHRT